MVATLRTRYPGVQPFTDDELSRRLFHGREEEAKKLTDQILANRFVVLFARSGLGKTSLLKIAAGLMRPTTGVVHVFDTTAGRNVAVTAATDIQVQSGRAFKAAVGQNLEINVRKSATVVCGNDLSLKSGDASIVTKMDGQVALKGKDISIEASGKINCKAAGNLILKGASIQEN